MTGGLRDKEKGQDLRSIALHFQKELAGMQDGRAFRWRRRPSRASATPRASRCRSSSATAASTLGKLQAVTQTMLEQARTQTTIANPVSSFRAGAPNLRVDIDRSKAETLKVAVGDVFSTLSAYLGSTFVNRFNKFGLSLQVYVQADSHYRAHPEDVLKLYVRSLENKMVPIGGAGHAALGPGCADHHPL